MKNPITEQEYTDSSEYVQSLINSYQEIERQQYQIGLDEKAILNALDEAAGMPNEVKGSFTVMGVNQKVIVKRSQNAKYIKDRGDTHPLRKLLDLYDDLLQPMIKVDYGEKGSEIEKFCERMAREGTGSETERELYNEILKVRVKTPAKLSVEVKELKPGERESKESYRREES